MWVHEELGKSLRCPRETWSCTLGSPRVRSRMKCRALGDLILGMSLWSEKNTACHILRGKLFASAASGWERWNDGDKGAVCGEDQIWSKLKLDCWSATYAIWNKYIWFYKSFWKMCWTKRRSWWYENGNATVFPLPSLPPSCLSSTSLNTSLLLITWKAPFS